MILPNPKSFKIRKRLIFTIKEQFVFTHSREVWEIFEKSFKEFYPDEYEKCMRYFDVNTSMYCYNMFISNKKFIDDYCKWLFPFLFHLETKIPITPYPYQNRVIGFLSERLLNYYLKKMELKVSALPTVFIS